ncbi:hypothetical protein [uncultured Acinetobacter sp.]|nr:hypothetical protein [uncultured Acinetobacter sp.]
MPKLSQPFTKAKARSATLWGRVEKLSAFVFRGGKRAELYYTPLSA